MAGPYDAEISRKFPGCLILMIDQSDSMKDPWVTANMKKADALAFAVNRLLNNAVLTCSRGEPVARDYFHVGVIGYGATVQPVLHGTDPTKPLVPISRIADEPLRIDKIPRKSPDGAGGLVDELIDFPVWVEPVHKNGTPMVRAFNYVTPIVRDWCRDHPDNFPPIVINITDGESTDGNPSDAAKAMQRTATSDGAVLIFNLHLSNRSNAQILLPDDAVQLPDDVAQTLFNCSSLLPEKLAAEAVNQGFAVREASRGFMFNADISAVIQFLNVGSVAVMPSNAPKELPSAR